MFEQKGSIIASNKVSSRVFAVSFSQDNSYFVTAGNRHVKFWYLDASKERRVQRRQPMAARFSEVWAHRVNFPLCPGEQHGAPDWSVWVARWPQKQCVLRGVVWARSHGVQHLLHHQLRAAVSVQQWATAGGLGQPEGGRSLNTPVQYSICNKYPTGVYWTFWPCCCSDVVGELSRCQWGLHLLWLCWRCDQSVQSIQPAVHHHPAPPAPPGSRPHTERTARVQILQTSWINTAETQINPLITLLLSTAACYLPVQVLSILTRWLWPLTPLLDTWPACTMTTACMCGTLKMWGTWGSCTRLCTTAAVCGA